MSQAGAFFAVLSALSTTSAEHLSRDTVERAVADALQYRIAPPLLADLELRGRSQELVRKCGVALPCMLGELRALHASLAMIVSVDLNLEPPLASLIFIDVAAGKELGRTVKPIPSSDEAAVARAVTDGAASLFDRAGLQAHGMAVFSGTPDDGHIQLTPPAAQTSERTFKLLPGAYRARGSREGYIPREFSFTIQAREKVELSMQLEPEPSWFESPWFWVAVGSAIAGAVVVGAVVSSPDDRCVCIQTQDGQCAEIDCR